MKPKKPKPTRADLERQILELKASQAGSYAYATQEIDKASTDHLMASGLLMQFHALGGRQVVQPVLIRDGLSKATIEAIKADMRRSWELATIKKPQGVSK